MPPAVPGIDLHCHSTASDGSLSPSALVNAAADAGVSLLALTDHDTLAGLPEARHAAAARKIRLLPGVEISVGWQRRVLHVVGLGVDAAAPQLQQGLATIQRQRRERAEAIALRLERLGIAGVLEQARALASGGQVTRTHLARVLVAGGHCRDLKQAFKRYLAHGKPAYVAMEGIALQDAVDWIHEAGGRAVLAHPLRYKMTGAWRSRMLGAFAAAGGDALEVCCGDSTPADVRTSAGDAMRHGLLGSVGSDFHSAEQHWIRLGRLPALPAGVQPVWSTM